MISNVVSAAPLFMQIGKTCSSEPESAGQLTPQFKACAASFGSASLQADTKHGSENTLSAHKDSSNGLNLNSQNITSNHGSKGRTTLKTDVELVKSMRKPVPFSRFSIRRRNIKKVRSQVDRTSDKLIVTIEL